MIARFAVDRVLGPEQQARSISGWAAGPRAMSLTIAVCICKVTSDFICYNAEYVVVHDETTKIQDPWGGGAKWWCLRCFAMGLGLF